MVGPMNRNIYYVLVGIIAFVLVGIFWWSVQIYNPLPIMVAFIIGVILFYLIRGRVSSIVDDERTNLINEKAALRTLEVFWVIFFVFSLGAFIPEEDHHRFPPPLPHSPPGGFPIHIFALVQMLLLCTMIFLYVGFRIYYARKFGEWDTDEE
jgi:uncharacterized membrane protein